MGKSRCTSASLPCPAPARPVADAHQRMVRAGRPDVVPMSAGQVVGRLNEVRPLAAVMAGLVREADETLERLAGLRDGRP